MPQISKKPPVRLDAAGDPILLKVEPLKVHDRMTVQQTLSHEHFGEQPTQVTSTYSRLLKNKEQPYKRRMVIGPTWQAIDLGWFTDNPNDVGTVIIENGEGLGYVEQPSPEEREAADKRIIEISFTKISSQADLCYPRSIKILHPNNADGLFLRCQAGQAKIQVHVYSR